MTFYESQTIEVNYTVTDADTVSFQWLRDGAPILPVVPPVEPEAFDEELTGSYPGGFVVPEGEVWKIDGAVTTDANVEVWGTLVMRAGSSITFTGIDETDFQGTDPDAHSHDVMASDIGLWVIHDGILNAIGTEKTPWLRAAGAISAGATSVTLESVPVGWLAGDEIIITPTAAPTVASNWTKYDTLVVDTVVGAVVTFTSATVNEHPMVDGTWTAELLNVTRDVNIAGTSGGRTHVIFNHTHQPQAVENVAIRYAGPRQAASGGKTTFVNGRYGIHIHMAEDASRGSTFDNIVVRDCGSHGIVTHLSHGVTWTGCITHDTQEDAYWWDLRTSYQDQGPPTNDLVYHRCVASKVAAPTSSTSVTSILTGFNLLNGNPVTITDCVAVGVIGSHNASGFHWPEGIDAVWTFEGCMAHNNAFHGIRAWQNSFNNHVIDTYTAYHNGKAGIDHGAYRNRYVYQNSTLYGNGRCGVLSHASALDATVAVPQRQTFTGITFDGGGITPAGIEISSHRPLPPQVPVLVDDCTFTGHTLASIYSTNVPGDVNNLPDWIMVTNSTLEVGQEFLLLDNIYEDSLITWVDGATTYYIRPAEDTTPGYTYNATWNAMVLEES